MYTKNVYQQSNQALQRISHEDFIQLKKNPIIIILNNIRSAHNVGAIFRLGDAFIVQKIYLCGITAHPPHKGIQKTALGAEAVVDWDYQENILSVIDTLSKEYEIIAIEQTNQSQALEYYTFCKKKKYAFIFGHEVTGIQPAILQQCNAYISITQKGTKHSLNVSTCAGIVLWQAFKNFL